MSNIGQLVTGKLMDYDYILRKLDQISEVGTIISQQGYDPAWNVALMMHRVQQLIQIIQDEANKEQKSK